METSRYAIGDEAFVAEAEAGLREAVAAGTVRADIELPEPPRVDVGAIEAAVAGEMGVERSLLHAHGHRGGDAKALAIGLCCRLSGLSQRRVGAHFGTERTPE
jgi:hypothetical protein